MYFKAIIAFSVLLLVSCGKGENIVGQVIDPSTKKGIPNVTVSYEGYQSGLTKTNSNGTFSIPLKNKKKYDKVEVFVDKSNNSELISKYFFPDNQRTILELGSDLKNPELNGYEYVDGNLTFTDTASGGPFTYSYLEYAVYSAFTLVDDHLKIKTLPTFTNNSIVHPKFIRGQMYVNGKVHYSNGTTKNFYDSIFVPKSVSSSFSWIVKF